MRTIQLKLEVGDNCIECGRQNIYHCPIFNEYVRSGIPCKECMEAEVKEEKKEIKMCEE